MKIGLCGKLRAGKDAVAAYLVGQYGFTRFAFGDALKEYAHALYDIPREPKPRDLYQRFGQLARQIDPDVWVKACFRDIDRKRAIDDAYYSATWNDHARQPFRPVITDLRQPNEIVRCRAEGYTIIRVEAPLEVRIDRAKAAGDAFDLAALEHDTETALDGYTADFTIDNSGTLAELHAQIDVIVSDSPRPSRS